MRKSFAILAVACVMTAAPAFAGNLSMMNGQTEWVSTQCPKPGTPESVRAASPETDGDKMNSMMSDHDLWVKAMQNYMNCLAGESDRDQTLVNQTISGSAQRMINEANDEINGKAPVR